MGKKKRPLPKIGNKRVRSPWEFRLFKEIKSFLKRRQTVAYEADTLSYVIEGTYTPDFTVEEAGDKVFFIEAKGHFDYQARRKMEAVKKAHPDKDIRILFQRDNYLRKRGKMKYSDWATKHGFTFAVGENLPKEWFGDE